MKRMLIVAAITALPAMADTWVMPNQGGGQIVLTDRKCMGYKELYYAYAYTDRTYSDGCWAVIDGKVHIGWKGGHGRRVYNLSDFTAEDITPKKKGQEL